MMKLIKIDNKYVNSDYITGIWVSPFKTKNDMFTIFIDFVNGETMEVHTLNIKDIDGIAKKIINSDIVECAKKIKEYCAGFAYGNCRSCALYRDGCFVNRKFDNNYDNEELNVFYPLDWEVE